MENIDNFSITKKNRKNPNIFLLNAFQPAAGFFFIFSLNRMDHILKVVQLTGESIKVFPASMGDGSDPMGRVIDAVLGCLQSSRKKSNAGNMTQHDEKDVSSAISFVFSPL